MMNSGIHKPPLAPKPKLALQSLRPGLSPSTPRRENLSLFSPGTQRRVKPLLAPKPCLSKLNNTPASESKPTLLSKSTYQTSSPVMETPRDKDLLNSQNGIQQENKKPDWDYIIPICLCSHENCVCIKNHKMEKDLKTLHNNKVRPGEENGTKLLSGSRGGTDTTRDRTGEKKGQPETNANHKPLRETFTLDKNLNMDVSAVTLKPSLPNRTWSDEANGNFTPHTSPGRGPEEDALGSEKRTPLPRSVPAPSRKPIPVPVPRKPRTPVLARQEKVEEEVLRDEIVNQEVRETNVEEEVNVSSPLLSAIEPAVENKQAVFLSARRACPPPRKKPLLSAPEKAAPTPDLPPRSEEDPGWDGGSVHEMEMEMEVSVDEEEVERDGVDEADSTVHGLLSISSPNRPQLSLPLPAIPTTTVTAASVREDASAAKVTPKKPKRHSGPMAWMHKKEKSEEKVEGARSGGDDEERGQVVPVQDAGAFKDRVMRELPSPPDEKTGRNLLTGRIVNKPPRSSLNKQKSKSFSGADLNRSDGQKRNSFRKLLAQKLSVMMLPKSTTTGKDSGSGGEGAERDFFHDQVRSERKSSCPLIGVEQCVDGDELFGGEEGHYENSPHYEEIPDYMNVGSAATSPRGSVSQPGDWQSSSMYDDEGIYEEQEPYMCFEKNTCGEQPQCPTPDYDRCSVDEEEVPPVDYGTSDDDILANTTDEEEDEEEDEDEDSSSSASSKGHAGELQPEDRTAPGGQKKSKIHHIASEIMSSESVFVDVLKLLHVDFREAVCAASRQSGKPVMEERLLNQILYSLPQLYQLNQDLLRELQHRVAQWDDGAQLADIFLNKGPYLKMYSTYIREFDKNVALLEEQSKKNQAFGAVVREFEASPRCANLALRHYLLKPVQRIPQYQLLLTDYLKNLSEDSADYKDTQAALALVKEVANHANDIMKQGDNFQKLIQVQCSLNGNHEIVQPGRIFLKDGVLKKLSRKVMQPRMFFLFNDVLLYTTPVQSGQYKLNNMLSLAGMKVSKPSQEACQNELKIESVERSFIVSASSAAERDEWLGAISTAISDYTKKKISFISGKPPEAEEVSDCGDGAPLGSKAPIWIPDPRTTMCMICTCDFTLTWRRHHCRACGKVVCQSCSSNKHCLEYLKNTLARVCDQCIPVLQQQKSEQALAGVSLGSRATFGFTRKHKKIPAALKEVTANTDNSSMSGYLQRSKGNKKQGKRLWFVIKDKVLYTYAASEDVAALESQPLLGFMLKIDSSQKLQFKLYHKNTLYHIFKADDVQTAQRWIDTFKEATVL